MHYASSEINNSKKLLTLAWIMYAVYSNTFEHHSRGMN